MTDALTRKLARAAATALTLAALAAPILAPAAAQARPPLSEVAFINDGLRDVAVADEIRKACDSISPRLIRAYQFLNSLENYARAQGYSEDEIENFVESGQDRKRLKAEAKAYMAANGVVPGDETSYCALGRAEIAQNSQIGSLLRAK